MYRKLKQLLTALKSVRKIKQASSMNFVRIVKSASMNKLCKEN